MRHAANRDACEGEVVTALQREGWGVFKLSAKDFPDLFCTRRGQVLLVECKKVGGALRPGQAKLHAALHLLGFLVPVAGNKAEALAASAGTFTRTYLNTPVEERGVRGPRGVRFGGQAMPRAKRGSRLRPAPASAPQDASPLPGQGPTPFRAMAPPPRPPESIPEARPRRTRTPAGDFRARATPATYPAAPTTKEKKP